MLRVRSESNGLPSSDPVLSPELEPELAVPEPELSSAAAVAAVLLDSSCPVCPDVVVEVPVVCASGGVDPPHAAVQTKTPMTGIVLCMPWCSTGPEGPMPSCAQLAGVISQRLVARFCARRGLFGRYTDSRVHQQPNGAECFDAQPQSLEGARGTSGPP